MYDFSRPARRTRATTLWLGVTTAWMTLGRVALPTATRAVDDRVATFADLLVAGSAAVAVLTSSWLWLVTTAVVADVLRAGPHARGATGPVRRALLAACGVAALSATAQPAAGDPVPGGPGGGHHPLHGLPLPDRAVGGVGEEPHRDRLPRVRVDPGDSLWAIAASSLGPDASRAEVASYWPRIHRANRAVIGDDPDLIRPGQRLDLPPLPTNPPGGSS